MIEQFAKLNKISTVCFLVSSGSLIGIPFLNFQNGMPTGAYMIACMFWLGLIGGCGIRVKMLGMVKKMDIKKKPYNKKTLNILTVIFAVLFIIILIFKRDSLALMSIDVACFLFTVEMYFFMKWRCNTEH